MKTCVIFGAAEGLPASFHKKKGDLLIAADAGILHLDAMGIKPDLAVGDFDSLGFLPDCGEVIRHPVKKNDTDSMLAVKTGWERGYRRFVFYGCSGGRPDHTFANYQVLCYLAARGGIGVLCQNELTACVFSKGTAAFSKTACGTLSLFSMGDCAVVSSEGLLYELNQTVLTCDFPLGQSNEFLGKPAFVQVHSGFLLAIWRGNQSDLLQFEPQF